jgi:deoxycytidylate deaminase
MKALNNSGVKELVYLKGYHRIQTGGEKMEDENESDELAQIAGITVRQYEGNIYCQFPPEFNIEDDDEEDCERGCAS